MTKSSRSWGSNLTVPRTWSSKVIAASWGIESRIAPPARLVRSSDVVAGVEALGVGAAVAVLPTRQELAIVVVGNPGGHQLAPPPPDTARSDLTAGSSHAGPPTATPRPSRDRASGGRSGCPLRTREWIVSWSVSSMRTMNTPSWWRA